MKKLAFVLFVLFAAFLTAPQSQAAIVMYDNANSWQTAMGAGNWQFVNENQILTGYADLPGNTLNLPLGKSVSFGATTLIGVQVDTEWLNWSGGNMPKVLYTNGAASVTGTFSAPMYAFGLEAQPNDWQVPYDITLTLANSYLTQTVDGNGGAKFFGWIGTEGITSMTLSIASAPDGFGIARAVAPVPIPGALLLLGPGLAALFGIRRKMKG